MIAIPLRPAVLLAALLVLLPVAAHAGSIFEQGFEEGNAFAWSLVVGEVPLAPYRFDDLDLRDPHLFVDVPGFGCWDFTDTALPFDLAPSFNQQLADLLTGDSNTDGLLDLSLIVGFRPFTASALVERLDLLGGACSSPLAGTVCLRDPLQAAVTTRYRVRDSGVCLMPLAGTTSGYTPAIAEPQPDCVVSEPFEATLQLAGVELPLAEVRLAAELPDAGPTSLQTGLFSGFLRESDADAVLLPADLPLVGGQPLSLLLPGGTGSCAAGDDRDLLGMEPGWWMYLNWTATPPAGYSDW